MRDGGGAGEMAPQLREPVTQPGRMEFGFQQPCSKARCPSTLVQLCGKGGEVGEWGQEIAGVC